MAVAHTPLPPPQARTQLRQAPAHTPQLEAMHSKALLQLHLALTQPSRTLKGHTLVSKTLRHMANRTVMVAMVLALAMMPMAQTSLPPGITHSQQVEVMPVRRQKPLEVTMAKQGTVRKLPLQRHQGTAQMGLPRQAMALQALPRQGMAQARQGMVPQATARQDMAQLVLPRQGTRQQATQRQGTAPQLQLRQAMAQLVLPKPLIPTHQSQVPTAHPPMLPTHMAATQAVRPHHMGQAITAQQQQLQQHQLGTGHKGGTPQPAQAMVVTAAATVSKGMGRAAMEGSPMLSPLAMAVLQPSLLMVQVRGLPMDKGVAQVAMAHLLSRYVGLVCTRGDYLTCNLSTLCVVSDFSPMECRVL